MKLRIFLIILTIFSISACNKVDHSAYKQDPILIDYQGQLTATIAELEAAKKQQSDALKELKDSQPQSGKAAIHTKRANDIGQRIGMLDQQVKFWKIRIDSRAKEAQAEYLLAQKNNKPWPDPVAVESYHTQKRLRLSKMAWDHKDRIEQMKKQEQEGVKAKHE